MLMCRTAGDSYLNIIDILVKNGADLTLRDDNGNDVLMLACMNGYTETCEHLMASGMYEYIYTSVCEYIFIL